MMYKNICELFELNVRRYPDKTAIVSTDSRITYCQLNRRVNRTANALLSLGVCPGDHVAFILPNSIELVQIYYAIQKIGAVAVPLDPKLAVKEIVFLLDYVNAKVLLLSAKSLDKLRQSLDKLSTVRHLIALTRTENIPYCLDTLTERASEDEPPAFRQSDALSRIQFTGGSTDMPRGVMRTHEADLTEIAGIMIYNGIGADADEVVLIQCPLGHHGGHSWYTAVFSSGGTLVISDAFDPETILRQIERERVTYMLLLPPSVYLRLCDSPLIGKFDVSSVKVIQSSAGGISPEIVIRISETFSGCKIYYGWGQTESGLGTSLVLTRSMVQQNLPQIRSVGRAMPFLEMRVIDENGNTLPAGKPGELAVKSAAVMSGYYGRPELTAEMLGEDGWLRTGDIMYMDDKGYAYMLSRKKDMIKSGGENIFAGEVESVIMQHPSVEQCVVVGVDDPDLSEAVLAVVRLREGCTLTLEDLQTHCKRLMASHKKPRYLEFVESFDISDAGKIRKPALREKYKAFYNQAK